ncbi:MAG: potassium channel family protein [Actinomycetota bacterium]
MKIRPPRRRRWDPSLDPWRRVRVGIALLATITAIGVAGYWLLGLSVFDALYQTIITVTTVGFEEIGSDTEIDTTYRVFTLGLAVFGVSGALYTLGVMVEALVEGSLNDGLRLRRGQRMIDKMSGHLIVVGAGRVGRAIVDYVGRHGADVVIIDRRSAEHPGGLLVVGEATDDDTLRRAGIDRATTLIAALDSDADNVYVTLSARALNPDLHIVARTNEQANEPKFVQAGADRVVNPAEIGGSRMGALAMHPTLAEFLDEVLHDESHGVTVDEIRVAEHGVAIGQTLGAVVGATGQPLIIAIRDEHHGYVANPTPTTTVVGGSVLVVLGEQTTIARLRRDLA